MTSEVEERIHRALQSHALEKITYGYRLKQPAGAGVSTLRLLPVNEVRDGVRVVAVAEIVADYNAAQLPPFSATGVQRLNAMAVHGAYHLNNGRLRQTAQYSIYENESAAHLAAQSILNAFGGQLPIGLSTALGTTSATAREYQRAHHGMPRQWQNPLPEESLNAAAKLLQERGLVASHDATAVWAELRLGGECPSRTIDPQAETAVLRVDTAVAHPIAGAGYFSTLSLPLAAAPAHSAEICRRLNALEFEQSDFVPRLGAWGLHGPDGVPGYCCFIPSAEPFGEMHVAMLWWSAIRAAWIRDRFWAARRGLVLEALTPGVPQ